MSNDDTNTTKFLPIFPAACPHVTSVGATEGRGPERASNFSSGGFSDYWPRPSWQQDAIQRYLDGHGDKWRTYYHAGGRAYPDVAAQGKAFKFVNHGQIELADGTRQGPHRHPSAQPG